MKKEKGVTLVTLVITITVLIIIAAIGTYSGIEVVNSSRLTAFTTELKIMQVQINDIYQEYAESKDSSILETGEKLEGEKKVEADRIFAELVSDGTSGITSTDTTGYRYWNVETIKSLGIEGVEQDCFVNVEKRSVISYKGLKHEGKIYYVLNQLPDNLYNVEYENPNKGAPTFDVKYEKIADNKWRVNIYNIQYDGYIDKWQVHYQLEGKHYWNSTEDTSFVVEQRGNYNIYIVNGEITSETKTVKLTGYVENGLLANYDGINNTGEGDNKHSTSITTWKNLAKTQQKDGVIHGATVKENHMLFDGKDDWVEIGEIKDKNNITFEVTVLFKNYTNSESVIVGNFQEGGAGLLLKEGLPIMQAHIEETYKPVRANITLEKNKKYNITGTYDGKKLKVYINGELKNAIEIEGSIKNPLLDTVMLIGANPRGNVSTDGQFANMELYQLRIYDRALTEKEIKENYEADQQRFY